MDINPRLMAAILASSSGLMLPHIKRVQPRNKCIECDKKIQPGRPGRKCKECREERTDEE